MDTYIFLPLIALIVNVFLGIYIIAQRQSSRLNKSFILFIINNTLGILAEIILSKEILMEYLPIGYKFASIFWLSAGFWFLNFCYEFSNKKKDLFFSLIGSLTFFSIVLSWISKINVYGFNIFSWGLDDKLGPYSIFIMVLLILLPEIYGLYLISEKAKETESKLIEKSALLINIGTGLSLIILIIVNMLAVSYSVPSQITESISIVQALFIFVAIYKYKLFSLGIEDISLNLFGSMRDGVIVTDKNLQIIHINKSAKVFFNYSIDEIKYIYDIEELKGIENLSENEREERKIKVKEKDKFILITRNKITKSDQYVGCFFYIKDITSRKNIELKLKESEKTFYELFEFAPDGLIVTDENNKIVQLNEEAENLFGYSKEILFNKEISFLIPNNFYSQHVQSKKNGNPSNKKIFNNANNLYGRKKDGTEFPIDLMESPITRFSNNMTLITIRDITEKKKYEQNLIESEEKYRNVVQNHPHGIIETTLDGKITLVNSAYAKLYEYEIKELLGRYIWEIQKDKKIFEEIKSFFDKAKFGKAMPNQRITRRQTKSGSFIDIQVDWAYKRNMENEPIGFITVVTDVTQRLASEKNLDKQRMLLTHAEQLAHLGSWEYDVLNDRFYWSDELLRIFGKNFSDFRPNYENYLENIYLDDLPKVKLDFDAAKKDGKNFSHICRIIDSYGDIRYLSTNGVVINDKIGKIETIFGSTLDITEFKKIEKELLISQKQLRALSASLQAAREEERTKIAREIHDEFGQMLTALNMDVGLMIEDLEENKVTSDELLKNLISMEDLINKAIKSIQNIATELRPDILDHLGLIPALEWQLNEFEKRYKIKTYLTKSHDHLEIEDEKKIALFRIFQEALTNVARHAQATELEISLLKNNSTFEMCFIDNGIGISAETLISVKSIGLIGIKERIYILGGEIFINTARKNGTEIHVKIPLN